MKKESGLAAPGEDKKIVSLAEGVRRKGLFLYGVPGGAGRKLRRIAGYVFSNTLTSKQGGPG